MVRKNKKPLPHAVKAKVNHRETLEFMITTPVSGREGLYVALREAINNSIDAAAPEVIISIGMYENEPAIIVSDNGKGFNKKGINSAMSYAASSRMREDTTTIGTNGTGLKSFLGLGNIEKTKLTILSVNQELPDCTKMEITFDYLLDLANNKAYPEKYVGQIDVPDEWGVEMERTSGSTVILTGFDGRKSKTPNQIVSELGEYLTPKAIHYVKVRAANNLFALKPVQFKGQRFEFAFETKTLGKVEFDLYYGENAGDGPIVCGAVNAILSLTELYLRMDKNQRGKVSKVWKTTSGHIYLEKGNTFRLHDGRFSDAFYESKACDELVQLLQVVSDELELLSEKKRNEDQLKRKQHIINQIVEVGKKISPPVVPEIAASAGNIPMAGVIPSTNEDYFLVPKGIRLHPGEVKVIVLNNKGRKALDPTKILWESSDKILLLLETSGTRATVKALSSGEAKLTVNGAFGTHVINVNISEKEDSVHISGPTYVKPGGTYTYELERYTEKSQYVWAIEAVEPSITGAATSNKEAYSVTIDESCPDTTFVIVVRSKATKSLIARKLVYVTEAGARKEAPVIKIAKKEYLLTCNAVFPDTVAQVDYLFHESEMPEIIVNPIHRRIKDLGYMLSMDHILVAIANAAIIDQVAEKLLKPSEAQSIVEEFVWKMKEELIKVKK